MAGRRGGRRITRRVRAAPSAGGRGGDRVPETLGKADRIKTGGEFSRVFREGRSVRDGSLRLYMLANDLGRSRLGVAVSLRHGKAVRRTRLRRLCREAFRTVRAELPVGYDYMMVPLPGRPFGVEGLRASLTSLAARLTRE